MEVSLSLLLDLESDVVEGLISHDEGRVEGSAHDRRFTLSQESFVHLFATDSALSRRLRKSIGDWMHRNGMPPHSPAQEAESNSNTLRSHPAWRALEPAIDGLKQLLQEVECLGRAFGAAPSPALVALAHASFDEFCKLLTRELGEGTGLPNEERDLLASMLRRELHPYLLLTRIVQRIYTKPRGYAGDFLTIRWMYENESGGLGAAGHLFDTVFLERPAAKAVRNRRALLARDLDRAIEGSGRVTSLACGPAEELFDAFAREDTHALRATAIDIDLQALAQVADRRDELGLERRLRLEQANLVRLATGRDRLELEPQDLIYSIGLIDYFQDRFVIALLNWIHDRLAPGGRVVLGNFHPCNPDRTLMDLVLDWRLVHRDEADMHRLFQASKFAAPCTEIRFEDEGVNLFATGVK